MSVPAAALRRRAALCAAAGLLFASGLDAGQTGASRRRVAVAAASDLQFAMPELAGRFRRDRPDLELRVTYGSSGNFFAQIVGGAPFDVLLSADVADVSRLGARGLTLPGSEFVYAVGRLVLWVPDRSPIDFRRGLAALADPSVRRIAIANPRHAPYGRAAEAALRSAGVYDAVRSRLALGENVAQAAQFVQSGAADAGLIALSLAVSPELSRAGRHVEVAPGTYPRIEQGGAVLARTGDAEAARAFAAFLVSPEARAVLERFGFELPS